MCGIAGLFAKDAGIEAELGVHLATMLAALGDRGPDSAGFAVYTDRRPGMTKLTLRAHGASLDADALASALGLPAADVAVRGTHVVLHVEEARVAQVREAVAGLDPPVAIVGAGRRMELYKEVGLPGDVARQFGLSRMRGTHAIGHTRMATESAVSTEGAHPFSTGLDQCLVHNGSLSNHNQLRRRLRRRGIGFATDNDSEVAASYLSARMRDGAKLDAALRDSLVDLDGFYTFVVGTEAGFAVLRDPIACKPAVMAETDRYVAFGSEYRALADLPGIETARVWEPEPAHVYAWERPH